MKTDKTLAEIAREKGKCYCCILGCDNKENHHNRDVTCDLRDEAEDLKVEAKIIGEDIFCEKCNEKHSKARKLLEDEAK